MKIAIIGRTKTLFDTALALKNAGHQIVSILTAKEAPEYKRSADDFHELAQCWSIPFGKGSKIINHIDMFQRTKADIAVSMNYTGIIPQHIIDLFPYGILNAHGGDLPRYRGNACQAWAILNGEKQIGLCVHKMIGGELDSGDIISRSYYNIDDHTKITDVYSWMQKETPMLFLDAVNSIANDPGYVLETQSKSANDALRCYPRTPDDCQIDWGMTNIDILRLINASNKPYPGAFCQFNAQRLIIWDAELVEDGENYLAIQGQVVQIGIGYVDVATGAGKIRLKEVELSGKIQSPDRVIRSIRSRLK